MKKNLIAKVKTMWFRHIRQADDKSFYRMIGLRRSGNHAIMNWLLGQMEGQVSVLNNMQKNAPEVVSHKKVRINGFGKKHLLVSHEDRPLEDFFLNYDEKQFGKSARRYTLLILRDPYNWLASWYAWKDHLGVRFREEEKFRNHTIALWKDYARFFMEWQENDLSSEIERRIPVNYNRWTIDQEYRRELAQKLGLKFTDKGRERVSINGYGSSFNGLEFQGKGSRMDVLNRWPQFADDETFRGFFDEELLSLGREIFPEISALARQGIIR